MTTRDHADAALILHGFSADERATILDFGPMHGHRYNAIGQRVEVFQYPLTSAGSAEVCYTPDYVITRVNRPWMNYPDVIRKA